MGSSYTHFEEECFLLHHVPFLVLWEADVKGELEVQMIHWEKDYKDRGEREREYAGRISDPNADLTSPKGKKGERRMGRKTLRL